ncbi:M50 family metallopeptidase [Streptomyces polyrhachis]|uniref:M50 family metallopeptidase n=1 Tax=Streptomyces polyrhachis TaxID=1282885 RepID=A0ABW2GBT0_9ACTN
MATLMWIIGVAVFVLGLLISIAWHELGHLSTAKMFGIRVPQYMVGFGPTVWSRRRGETEYGFKAIPAGGYIRMVGMFPPGEDGKVRQRSTSPFRGMIEDARAAAYEELQPGDETRMFYTRTPWKRVIVMFAGPFMNLVLAVVVFLGVWMAYGVPKTTTTVSSVADCVISQKEERDTCRDSDKAAPAAAAGIKPGDRIVAYDGRNVTDWKTLQGMIRDSGGPVTITVERDGQRRKLRADVIENDVIKNVDDPAAADDRETVKAGYLGLSPGRTIATLSAGESVERFGDMFAQGVDGLVALPSKIPDLWDAAFMGEERRADSPVGVVGAARVGGEVAAMELPASERVVFFLQLVAWFNLSLFLFNMLPLLPLDGGHIAGALWESIRRGTARVFRRPDPGPFDVAKLMPVAYVVAGVFVCFTLLVLVADVVNPVRLTG